jgi:hypothetical protein
VRRSLVSLVWHASPLYVLDAFILTTLHYCTLDAKRLKTAGRIKDDGRTFRCEANHMKWMYSDDKSMCRIQCIHRKRDGDDSDDGVTTAKTSCHWRRRGRQRRTSTRTTIWTSGHSFNVLPPHQGRKRIQRNWRAIRQSSNWRNTGVRDRYLISATEWVSMFDLQTARSL